MPAGLPPRQHPATAARLRAMARVLARANASDDPEWVGELRRAAWGLRWDDVLRLRAGDDDNAAHQEGACIPAEETR